MPVVFQAGGRIGSHPGEPVEVKWLGTAGVQLTYAGHVVLIDPFLTRPSLLRCMTGPLESEPVVLASRLSRADAILVGHTHFDHMLDVPVIARNTGAAVYGSWSAARICHAQGVPSRQVHVVEPAAAQTCCRVDSGPFHIRFIRSEHARILAGRVPFAGEVRNPPKGPMWMHHYRAGAVFVIEVRVGGRLLVHIGSARVTEVPHTHVADLVLLCAAGWNGSPELPDKLLHAWSPRAVLLTHWDDFFRSLEEPVRALPSVRMDELALRLGRRVVGTLPPYGTIEV